MGNRQHVTRLSAVCFALGIAVNAVAQQCQPHWSSGFEGPPLTDTVLALAFFEDGLGGRPTLFAGGNFAIEYGSVADGIARRDGKSWSALPETPASQVFALAVFDDGLGGGSVLYLGGDFETDEESPHFVGLAKWDGATLTFFEQTAYARVHALAVFDDGTGPALYAAGDFKELDGIAVRNIARWDGVEWSPLGEGIGDWIVYSIHVFDDGSGAGPSLYAGGDFTEAGGRPANYVARWDGAQWSPLGEGANRPVRGLATFDDGAGTGPALYAIGAFFEAGGAPANSIAKWDGNSWSPLGDGLLDDDGDPTDAYALEVFDDGSGTGPALYAGGDFRLAGGAPADCIARWDGSSWSPVGKGIDETVWTLMGRHDGPDAGLYAGGYFAAAGDVAAHNIAKWDGAVWSAPGTASSGFDDSLKALAVFDDGSEDGPALHAGGRFVVAGEVRAERIAKFDGKAWSPLGEGLTPVSVNTLVVFDDQTGSGEALYADGAFTMAGQVSADRIARWDGQSWSSLDSQVTPGVGTIAEFDDGGGDGPALYATGHFQSAGGVEVDIARWDGHSWSPLGSGTDGGIRALHVFDDGLGGGPALYAGGKFAIAGGVEASDIARWYGESWSPLGGGIAGEGNCYVEAFATFDDGNGPALYVGGNFDFAGGVAASNIARWDGKTWSSLGAGVDRVVLSLAVFDDGTGEALYVGGSFDTAGGQPAWNIARWDGQEWSALGGGANNEVWSLLAVGNDLGVASGLYVGGSFDEVDGITSYHIARWEGCPPTPGDLDADGDVDASDLIVLLGAWGPCGDCADCAADLHADCIVNGVDLLILFGNWS